MNYIFKLPSFASIFLIFFMPLFGLDKAEISADFSRVITGIKPESIRGVNVNNSMPIIKILKKVKLMKIPTIEYPAGNTGEQIDLQPNDNASMNFFHLQQTMLGSPFTFVQVRVFKGTAEEAARSVLNAFSNRVRVDVWNVGNEPDLYYKNNAPDWTMDRYNEKFREYVTAMKKVDPDVRVAGPLVSQPKDEWIKGFIRGNGDIVDVLAWHWYPTDGDAPNEVAIKTAPDITNQICRYRSWLKDPVMNPRGYKREIKLALCEYAIHWNSPKLAQLTDMTGAIWTAEVMGYMAQYGMDYSHYFCLGTLGGHAIFENETYAARPVYYVFIFYAGHFGEQMVYSESGDSDIKVFAGFDSEGLRHFIVINENPSARKEINITIDGAAGIKSARGYVLDDDSSGLELDSKMIYINGKNLRVHIPAYSVDAFDIE